MNILIGILLGIDVLVALLMTLVILMQRPKSEGLGAAFGGGVTENIFGAQTTNVLVKFTGWLAGIFFVVTFLLSILYAQRSNPGGSSVRRELQRGANATTTASPAKQSASPAPSASSKPTGPPASAAPQQAGTAASPSPSVASTPPKAP